MCTCSTEGAHAQLRVCTHCAVRYGDVTGIFMESYDKEFILNPNKNEFIPTFWKREVDDVYCLWQYGPENIRRFLDLLKS